MTGLGMGLWCSVGLRDIRFFVGRFAIGFLGSGFIFCSWFLDFGV